MVATHRTGRIYPRGDYARILSAELAPASDQVADALGVPAGAEVIRRHRVTYHRDAPVSASTSYFDGAIAALAPKLLETERLVQGTPGYIAEQTGRIAAHGRDQLAARPATAEEAAELGIEPGSPVLGGRNWSYDAEGGVVEYGESVSVPNRWSSYDYDLA